MGERVYLASFLRTFSRVRRFSRQRSREIQANTVNGMPDYDETPRVIRLRRTLPVLAILLFAGGCSPSVAPLFRDYEISSPNADGPLLERIERALINAGWSLAPRPTPNVVATERRKLSDWGLYKVEAYLEAAPLGGEHVRVFVHPQRRYLTGGRTKMPFLARSLRQTIMSDLNESFEKQGLIVARSARERGLTGEG